MARTKGFFDAHEDQENFQKIEKIKKRKKPVRTALQDDWIFSPSHPELLQEKLAQGFFHGRVIEVQKRHLFVAEENKEGEPETQNLWFCSVAKRHFQRVHTERNFVVVGDRVLFLPEESANPEQDSLPRGVIHHAFARSTQISRKDPLHPGFQHVMLANIDLIAVVASVLHPKVRWGLIDRFLVQAEFQGLLAVIILNKVDLLKNKKLASPAFLHDLQSKIQLYRSLGYEVVELCALKKGHTPQAYKQLSQLFRGKLVGLAGHSGVGKSSVVNLFQPEFLQVVDENPHIFYKGRHTTTYNSLLQLKAIRAYAIDTPGIRSFSLEQQHPLALSACFVEFRNHTCKYQPCSHDHEPHCKIQEAVAQGKIAQHRYKSYLAILKGTHLREEQEIP